MSRNKRRGILAAGATGCLVLAMLMGGAGAASAADGPWDITGMPTDPVGGTIPDAGVANNLDDDQGNVQELGPLNSNTTKIGVIHNDAVPTLGTTNPNAQVDLRQAWLDIKREGGKDWLYFAWERDKSTGSGFIAYEFMRNAAPAACAYETATDQQLIDNCNPWANRQGGAPATATTPAIPGDFMILWDQQGGGLDMKLRIWSGTAPNLVLGPPVDLTAAVSQAAISDDGFFGEAAVNLTDTIFGGVLQCLSFANSIPSTVTGNSDTADYKDTILQTIPPISNCTTTTTTTPKLADGTTNVPSEGASIGTGGVLAVTDSATVALVGATSGTPGGTVAFSLCKLDSGTCTSGGTAIGSATVTATAYPFTVVSPTAYVTSAGRYCWRAVYDDGNATNGISGSSDSSAGECFVVNPVTPTLTTSAGADVVLGNAVTDTATLSGTALQPMNPVIQTVQPSTTVPPRTAAGGKITFTLYTKTATTCVPVAGSATEVTVNGDSSATNVYSVSFTPTVAGTYQWGAVYSDSTTNTNGTSHNNGTCNVSAEEVVVNTVPSTMTTAQRWVPNDSATIKAAAGGNLAGNARFTLYNSSDCTGTIVYGPVDVPVSGPGTGNGTTVSTSNSTAVTASGSYSWSVSYDSTNLAQDDIAASCKEVSSLTINNNFVQP
jgi:hypothetical protein